MRVIAGSARGMRLCAPKGMQTRPTADRVKEALFSILGSRRDGTAARVLDICAGSGALGIESLSRGAEFCCFVEQNRVAVACIEKNLQVTRFRDKAEILSVDAVNGVKLALKKHGRFSLVFFDPPYSSGLYAAVIPVLAIENVLNHDGVLVVECSADQSQSVVTEKFFKLLDRRLYGDTALEFYVRSCPE